MEGQGDGEMGGKEQGAEEALEAEEAGEAINFLSSYFLPPLPPQYLLVTGN